MKFIQNNRVLLVAIASALILTLQQFAGKQPIEWKAIGLAALIAVLGVIGRSWKGQGLSITGIVGNMAYAFVTIWETGTFTWHEFVLQSLIAILAVFAPTLQPEPETKS